MSSFMETFFKLMCAINAWSIFGLILSFSAVGFFLSELQWQVLSFLIFPLNVTRLYSHECIQYTCYERVLADLRELFKEFASAIVFNA